MAGNVPSRLIGELTFQEVSQRLRPSSILCLPIGSIEQHGPHLPLNTDAVLAEEFTRRIIGRWSETYDLWQLPTLTVSLAREHEWAPGTLSLSIRGMAALVRDLGREIARGFPTRNLTIINGHGGNRGILEALTQDLRADFGLNVCVLHPAVWAEASNNTAVPEIHGGKNETSMMLAIAPHQVRRDQIPQKINLVAEAIRAITLDQAATWPWTSSEKLIADMGVIGDPKTASAEWGKRLLEQIAKNAGGIFKTLLDRQNFEHN
jgi:creatinine amidohydrolase